MNCQDISRIADTGRMGNLTADERHAVEAHVISCSRCAAVWSAHSRLMALDNPPMPAEVTRRFHALAALPVQSQGRHSLRRLTVIGGLVVLAAAAGVLIWSLGNSPPLVPASSAAGDAPLPFNDAATSQGPAPDATPAPGNLAASTTGSGDEAAMCAQTIKDAEAFAVREQKAANPGSASESRDESDNDRLLAELHDLQRRWAGSRDPDLFLAAVLLDSQVLRQADDPFARTMLRDLGVRAAESGSPMMRLHALSACVRAQALCPFADLEQRLLEGSQNAESWSLVATLRYQRGDVAGALAAMQGAARAPTSTWYWTEAVALVERSLAADTAMSFALRVDTAFGSAAGTLPPMEEYTMCRVESARSRAWAQACLAFATLRAGRNETIAAQSVGQSMREQALTALGETERAAEVAAERALFDTNRRVGGSGMTASLGELQHTLIVTSPARLRAYLGAIQQFGETAGSRVFLRQQLPPLLERAGLLEREGAKECVAQFFAPRTALGTRAATARRAIEVADELLISVHGGMSLSTTQQVHADGTIMMPLSYTATMVGAKEKADQMENLLAAQGRPVAPREGQLVVAGKTTAQLQREIATLLTRRGESPEVLVILVSPRSREELRLEFDNAWQEAGARREQPR